VTKEFQSHVNGLRALAVIGVVLFHFQLLGINSGFVGVDIFFVISGYLMTRILFEKEFSSPLSYFTEFWMARVRRITPALIVLTLVCLCVFTTLLLFPDYKKFLRSNVTANLFLSNYFFLVQSSYFDTQADTNPLLHTWSLSVEWQFYLIYPFVIYLLRKHSFAIKLGGISALTVGSYAYCGILTGIDSTSSYFELAPRIWEFLVGAIIYLIATNHSWLSKVQCSRMSNLCGVVSLWVIFVSLIAVNKSIFPGWVAAFPVIATGFLILNGQKGATNVVLSSSPLQFIGNLSYSLYLWHWPIYVYFVMAVAIDRPLSEVEKIVCLLISFSVSFISYKWIEQPTRRKSAYWSNKKVMGFWISSILISIAALAIAQKSNETSYRLPAYLANAEKALVDINPRRAECFFDRHQVMEHRHTPTLCRIGTRKNEADAILWGDSFADAIQPMIEDVLISNQLSGVVSTLAGCLPLNMNAYKEAAYKEEFGYCDKGMNQKTLTYISNSPSVKYVFISANWIRYDSDVLNHEFAAELCSLKKMGRHPMLIGPVPAPNYDVPRRWGRLELKDRDVIDTISFSRTPTFEAEAKFSSLIEHVKDLCGNVHFVMPSATYCESNDCFSVKDGKALFVDKAHLSNQGANLMRRDVDALLQKAMKN